MLPRVCVPSANVSAGALLGPELVRNKEGLPYIRREFPGFQNRRQVVTAAFVCVTCHIYKKKKKKKSMSLFSTDFV